MRDLYCSLPSVKIRAALSNGPFFSNDRNASTKELFGRPLRILLFANDVAYVFHERFGVDDTPRSDAVASVSARLADLLNVEADKDAEVRRQRHELTIEGHARHLEHAAEFFGRDRLHHRHRVEQQHLRLKVSVLSEFRAQESILLFKRSPPV